MTSVWPALWPPWKRTTMSARSDSQSTILPLPSSPHWAPTTATLAMPLSFQTRERPRDFARNPPEPLTPDTGSAVPFKPFPRRKGIPGISDSLLCKCTIILQTVAHRIYNQLIIVAFVFGIYVALDAALQHGDCDGSSHSGLCAQCFRSRLPEGI